VDDSKSCPKCGQGMIQGFIADNLESGVAVSHWVEGEPQTSWLGGLKTPIEKSLPVGTFRCMSCGFLESYALLRYSAKKT
jgi:hypothetical protein